MTGKRLNEGQTVFVIRLYKYFQKELANDGALIPLTSLQQRVAEGLGIAERTVREVLRKERLAATAMADTPSAEAECGGEAGDASKSTPSTSRKFPYASRKKWKTSDLPDAVKEEVRNVFYDMVAKRQHITANSLRQELAERQVVNFSTTSLKRLLHDIGFKFNQDNNRRALMEQKHIVVRRAEFLRQFRKNERSEMKRKVVFLDETWVFAKGGNKRTWHDDNVKSVRRGTSSEGKRFIVLHAGTEDGFVPNASLIFGTKSKLADYHGDMNAELFMKWIKEQLVPNLEEPSVIVMDNASYHSVCVEKNPTSAWTKGRIQEWLQKHNVPFNQYMFKDELLNLAKCNAPPKRYVVDEYLQEHGHEVIRLPPYHCQFNAIELAWAQAKKYYDSHMGEDGYGDEKVLEMWERSIAQCTQERWRDMVKHTVTVIDQWHDRLHVIDDIPEIIIHLGEDSSDEEESDRENLND